MQGSAVVYLPDPPVKKERICIDYSPGGYRYVVEQHHWKGKRVKLRLHWDHIVPFTYSQNNRIGNFAAACNVCNKLKSCLMFKTLEEARVYIHAKREAKGYTDEVFALPEGVPRQSEVAKVL